ncbi:PLP-dependent cysteine synthase family protein [Roseibacillus persicicus]|uniref:PLP-dependent cysteine synthase family protein n=1 Tax=Roseibacillus persicicus TaxID=454148 RepID=UPI0035EA2270
MPFPSPCPPNQFLAHLPPTPLVPVQLGEGEPVIWCKLEFLNPSGSTKDRIARTIVTKALRRGALQRGDLVVEASSGSTSISLAQTCAQLGLRFLAFIPSSATNERALMIRAYGGEVRRVEGTMPEVIEQAAAFAEREGAFAACQFENPDNTAAHCNETAREILAQLPYHRVDAVVSGVGTGGSLVGLHQGLTAAGCSPLAVAAIPKCGEGMPSCVECCSLEFSRKVPGVIDGCSKIYSDWKETNPQLVELPVADGDCLEVTKKLWKLGFPVGPSSGLNLQAALRSLELLPENSVVVTVFPDRMERYFSHPVFAHLMVEMAEENGVTEPVEALCC